MGKGKILAIKGHPTRGKEVIEVLEMLGGINVEGYIGTNTWKDKYYFLDNGCIRAYDWCDAIKFTLEEFLEKYPYKVGDIVDRTLDYVSCVIDNMRWNSEKCCVEYHLNYLNGDEYGWHVSECLIKPENKDVIIGTKIESTGFMQMGKTIAVIFNSENYEDEVELQLGDYEIAVRDGKTYAVKKKPAYPKSYEECCDVLKIPNDERYIDIDVPLDYNKLLSTFTELLICRKAYCKIAGEEMGLDKPWTPDWTNGDEYKHCLYINEDVITKGTFYTENKILSFPTVEMRNAFYENFKNEIEQCKELL